MQTFVAGIMTAVTEKYEFEYRNKTIILNISQTFCPDYYGRVTNNDFPILYKNQAFDWDTHETDQALIVLEK